MVRLRGTTWNHTRGYAPLVAAAQGWTDLHPDVEIVWDKRSLRAFGEGQLDELARSYDLLVIDHPLVGSIVSQGLLVPLDEELPAAFLERQSSESVGPSFRSYTYRDHQWALAIDASGQVSAWRPDLLERRGLAVPATWDEVVALAKETGGVLVPLTPIDALSSFLTLCGNAGDPPFRPDGATVVARDVGELALLRLEALSALAPPSCLEMDPVAVLNRMASGEDVLYAPLLYAYSNYARDGFAPSLVAFGDIPDGWRGGATLGGAGLAVSARSEHRAEAVAFAAWVTRAACQRTLYVLAGGQPGNRVAWEDDLANKVAHRFFRSLLPVLDRAYLRPNHDGFARFQAAAGSLIHGFLRGERSAGETLDALDRAHAETGSDLR